MVPEQRVQLARILIILGKRQWRQLLREPARSADKRTPASAEAGVISSNGARQQGGGGGDGDAGVGRDGPLISLAAGARALLEAGGCVAEAEEVLHVAEAMAVAYGGQQVRDDVLPGCAMQWVLRAHFALLTAALRSSFCY